MVVEETGSQTSVVFEETNFLANPVLLVLKVAEELAHALVSGETLPAIRHRGLQLGQADAYLLVNLFKLVLPLGELLLQLLGVGLDKAIGSKIQP